MEAKNYSSILAQPVTLSPVEITDTFVSHYSCCRHLEILFVYDTALT